MTSFFVRVYLRWDGMKDWHERLACEYKRIEVESVNGNAKSFFCV